jgi:hypothetical protein
VGDNSICSPVYEKRGKKREKEGKRGKKREKCKKLSYFLSFTR